jgi:hypothetical protein
MLSLMPVAAPSACGVQPRDNRWTEHRRHHVPASNGQQRRVRLFGVAGTITSQGRSMIRNRVNFPALFTES